MSITVKLTPGDTTTISAERLLLLLRNSERVERVDAPNVLAYRFTHPLGVTLIHIFQDPVASFMVENYLTLQQQQQRIEELVAEIEDIRHESQWDLDDEDADDEEALS